MTERGLRRSWTIIRARRLRIPLGLLRSARNDDTPVSLRSPGLSGRAEAISPRPEASGMPVGRSRTWWESSLTLPPLSSAETEP